MMDVKAKAVAFLDRASAAGIGPAEAEALIREVAEEVAPPYDFEAAFSELKGDLAGLKSEMAELKAMLAGEKKAAAKPQKGKDK